MKRIAAIPLIIAILVCSCSVEPLEQAVIELDKTIIDANKRGVTYEGGAVTFEVKSNVYWVISGEPEWITLNPKAGHGTKTVTVNVAENHGDAREAVLDFDSYDGVTAQITIRQASASELIVYMKDDFGTDRSDVPLSEFGESGMSGTAVSFAKLSGSGALVSQLEEIPDYEGAFGANAVFFNPSESEASYLEISPIETDDLNFVLSFYVKDQSGTGSYNGIAAVLGDGSSEYPLELAVKDASASGWAKLESRFHLTEPSDLHVKIVALSPCVLDDVVLYEGNEGEGEEVWFSADGDDGKPLGFVYFADDFSWVTDVYGGSDYVAGWPANTTEVFWNNITEATHGEAYNTLVASGWTLSDDQYKQRVYLRLGYVKMGRSSNSAGSGGGLMTPLLGIRKRCTATLDVAFDCCDWYGTGGAFDSRNVMMVRVVGDGTINDTGEKFMEFSMSTSAETEAIWKSGLPDKNPWERKEFLVRGASENTRIVFESVEKTTANRWFFDNVTISKCGNDAVLEPVKTKLATPALSFDEDESSPNSIKFNWEPVENASAYEYVYTCLYCGQEVDTRSGFTSEVSVVFDSLDEGTACKLKVRAIPEDGDKLYLPSDWSDEVKGETKPVVETVIDSHEVGFVFVEDDLSWVTKALCTQDSFVSTYPSNPSGIGFASVSAECAEAIRSAGWEMVSKAYLYEGCIKLGTASAVGSVLTPYVRTIDSGAAVNALVTLGATAFLGTNDYYDSDLVRISIVGEGCFEDGSSSVEFNLGCWNDWGRSTFFVKGITAETRFSISTVTAAKGRVMIDYFSVVKLADDYDPTAQIPALAVPSGITVSDNTAYGFDLNWSAVENATDYDYRVVRPDGIVVAEGKTWENRVHIGGLEGKTVPGHAYYNVRIRANHMNYDSTKTEVPQTFSSSLWSSALKCDLTDSGETLLFSDDFSWTTNINSQYPYTDWLNTYCTVDKSIRFDYMISEGTVDMNGWGYPSSTKKSIYVRPGYIQMNSSSALGAAVTPAFSMLEAPTDVKISFDACGFYQYFSGVMDTSRIINVEIVGSGTFADGSNVLSITLERSDAWQDCTATILSASSDTYLVIGTGAASKNRVFFDNFRLAK